MDTAIFLAHLTCRPSFLDDQQVSKPVIGSLVLKERLTDEDVVYLALKDIS